MIYFSICPANIGHKYQYSISNTSTNSLRQKNRKHRSQCCGYNSWYLLRLLSANLHNSVEICKGTYRKKALVPEQSQQRLWARMRNERFAKQVLLKLPAKKTDLIFLSDQNKSIAQTKRGKNILIWRGGYVVLQIAQHSLWERSRTVWSIPPLLFPIHVLHDNDVPWFICILYRDLPLSFLCAPVSLSLKNDHWKLFPKQ